MLDGISLLENSTAIVPTGGTALVFEDDSVEVSNGIHLAENTAGVDFSDRRHMTYKSRSPQRQTDGTFSKAKRDVNVTIPFTNAAGVVEYAVARCSFELPEEYSDAQVNELRYLACQSIADSESDNFYHMGSRK